MKIYNGVKYIVVTAETKMENLLTKKMWWECYAAFDSYDDEGFFGVLLPRENNDHFASDVEKVKNLLTQYGYELKEESVN